MTINILATDRRRLPLPPRQLPLLRGQPQRQRLVSRLRHERRLVSRRGVSGTGRVANCPRTAPPSSRPPRHTLPSPPSRPPRHALVMWPPRKTRLFGFLNYPRAGRRRSSSERGPANSSIKTGGVKKPSFSGQCTNAGAAPPARAAFSCRPFTPPARSARSRRPLAPPARAARSRRPFR